MWKLTDLSYFRRMAMREPQYTMQTEQDRKTLIRLIEDAPAVDPDTLPIVRELREKLARYEQAEAEGRLIELPCKIGERVFKITDKYDGEYCNVCCYDGYGMKEPCPYYMNNQCTNIAEKGNDYHIVCIHFRYSHIPEFGKNVFLTREEAENALKEMEE